VALEKGKEEMRLRFSDTFEREGWSKTNISRGFVRNDADNSQLGHLERELSTLYQNGKIDSFCLYLYGLILKQKDNANLAFTVLDPFCLYGLYLYGLILKQKGNANLASTVLVEFVNSYPWNRSAWIVLQSLCISVDILIDLRLKSHWMKDIFLGCVYHSLRTTGEAISLHQLASLYSEHGRNEEATLFYKMKLKSMESKERDIPKMLQALLFLGKYYYSQIDLKQLRRARQPTVYLQRFNPHNLTCLHSVFSGSSSSSGAGFMCCCTF
jgi:tetratricopeptide (TPR) repeat protein